MKQDIKHGATLETATPDEVDQIVGRRLRTQRPRRIRATASLQLDAAGNGREEVYTVPPGYEFVVRRVVCSLDKNGGDPFNKVALNVAGVFIDYLRSGTVIEHAQPQYGGSVQVDGVQTWGSEQGPYMQNGEVFEVQAHGLTAIAVLIVTVEGILAKHDEAR